jgi:hypothetical protein
VLCSWLGYEHIREVQKRRYLLQPIALEIFSKDERNHLLAFLPQQGLPAAVVHGHSHGPLGLGQPVGGRPEAAGQR